MSNDATEGRLARLWDRFVRFVIGPGHVRPETFDELVEALEGQRQVSRWKGRAIALLVLSLPAVTWISVSIGERAREQNCDVAREALHAFSDGIVDTLVAVSDPPTTPEERKRFDRIEKGLRAGFHRTVDAHLTGCE